MTGNAVNFISENTRTILLPTAFSAVAAVFVGVGPVAAIVGPTRIEIPQSGSGYGIGCTYTATAQMREAGHVYLFEREAGGSWGVSGRKVFAQAGAVRIAWTPMKAGRREVKISEQRLAAGGGSGTTVSVNRGVAPGVGCSGL